MSPVMLELMIFSPASPRRASFLANSTPAASPMSELLGIVAAVGSQAEDLRAHGGLQRVQVVRVALLRVHADQERELGLAVGYGLLAVGDDLVESPGGMPAR